MISIAPSFIGLVQSFIGLGQCCLKKAIGPGGRNAPERRAESPDRLLDLFAGGTGRSGDCRIEPNPMRADSFKSRATLSAVARWLRFPTGGECRGQRQHRSRQRPDPETRSTKVGAFNRTRRLSQIANRRRWLAQGHAGMWCHVATEWRQRDRISAAKIRAFGRVP
jgi:hypothetical protein